MGISADLQQHIFDKFARGRHETDIHGSGLGLYLVNWIARFHGGYTEVVSTPGQGSTFRLFLPKCSTAPVLHLSN
jgi:signal transduction histidine kinase